MKYTFYFLECMCLFFYSCTSNSYTTQEKISQKIHTIYRDEINRVSDTNSILNYQKNPIFRTIKQNEQIIHLWEFNPDSDSVLIRVWINIGLNKIQNVVEFGVRNDSINGSIFEYFRTEKRDSLGYIRTIIPKKVAVWSKVFDESLERQILFLPDMEKLSDVPQFGGDGSDYCIEIYTKKTYRFYSYWCPFQINSKNSNVLNFKKFMLFLKKSLELKFKEC